MVTDPPAYSYHTKAREAQWKLDNAVSNIREPLTFKEGNGTAQRWVLDPKNKIGPEPIQYSGHNRKGWTARR